MTTKLLWRLGKLPSPDEVRELVKDKIITQEEARDILFKKETDEERDTNSLKEEIKFLRETIEQLSKNNRSQLIETIKYVQVPTYHQPWTKPYEIWCSAAQALNSLGSTAQNTNFTAINTF